MIIIKATLPVRWELDEAHESVQKFLALEPAEQAFMLDRLTRECLATLNTNGSWCRLEVDDQTITQAITEGDSNAEEA